MISLKHTNGGISEQSFIIWPRLGNILIRLGGGQSLKMFWGPCYEGLASLALPIAASRAQYFLELQERPEWLMVLGESGRPLTFIGAPGHSSCLVSFLFIHSYSRMTSCTSLPLLLNTQDRHRSDVCSPEDFLGESNRG